MSTKKIVLLKSHLSRLGGAEKYTLRLAKAFQDKHCQVTILSSGKELSPNSIPTLFAPHVSKLSYRHVQEFDKWCFAQTKILQPDAILGLDRNRFQTHIRASNGVHAAFLEYRGKEEGFWKKISLKFNPLHRLLLQIEKEGFENKDLQKLFTNSYMVKNEILRFYNVAPNKIQVIHNGVEWEEFQNAFDTWQEVKEKQCEALGLNPKHFQFLFIGHNYRRKGLTRLLQALSLMKKKEFHLSVIGKDKNAARFLQLAETLGLKDKVTFFGERSDTSLFYQIADCLAIPSLYDPFANVTVEALAMGLFIVSSKTNGGHEVLTPQNGVVIEDLDDPASFQECLEIALQHPKTPQSAHSVRNSIKYLDFSTQLNQFIDAVL